MPLPVARYFLSFVMLTRPVPCARSAFPPLPQLPLSLSFIRPSSPPSRSPAADTEPIAVAAVQDIQPAQVFVAEQIQQAQQPEYTVGAQYYAVAAAADFEVKREFTLHILNSHIGRSVAFQPRVAPYSLCACDPPCLLTRRC